MKRLTIAILFLSTLFAAPGCKKFLDVNTNPNNPPDVQEPLILTGAETTIGTSIASGGPAVTVSYWMQQMALNQVQPQIDGYLILPDGEDGDWANIYVSVLNNMVIMNKKALAHGNYNYAGVAKILNAYSLGIATDLWGDIPYSQALQGTSKLKPGYDKQEDIYKDIQLLLDSAIINLGTVNAKQTSPGADDFIYNGDMSLWLKFAYSLKARDYIHLAKAPGYTAAAQAALALTALQKGFQSNDDEAAFSYPGTPGGESPWYENTLPGAGGVVLSSNIIDSMVSRKDPRLPVIATVNDASPGIYVGRPIGAQANPDPTAYSQVNTFYAGIGSKSYIMDYTENLFIKAEALFYTSGAAAATPVFVNGINAHMAKLGIDTNSVAAKAYITLRTPLTPANALQRIVEEKWEADFLSIENYNDWRRTGFPVLPVVQNSYLPAIPKRFPYPLSELTSNPQPEQSATLSTPVWWNQ
jgi:hypothetical protein